MKLFTLKDFILYNGPCINCGSKVNVNLHKFEKGKNKRQYLKLNTNINSGILSFNLRLKYSIHISINIDITTNKYSLNWIRWNDQELKSPSNIFNDYMQAYELIIKSTCPKCGTFVSSNKFEFNKDYIKPLTIHDERIIMYDGVDPKQDIYVVESDFLNKTSKLSIWGGKGTHRQESFALPLLPLYKLKNRKKAIDKFKKIILFS